MKVALGLYTTLYSAPQSLFDKTLSLVYEPILSYLYTRSGNHLFLYQSSEMMKYIKRERQEYKTLISMFMKRGDIVPLTGVWNESVLSLLPPKDRAGQIEKLTSEIKHDYAILPTKAFFYGEVWQSNYVTLLNNVGIDSVVISTYDGRTNGSETPFVMNELGKRVNILPVMDDASSATREYSEGKIGFEDLRHRLLSLIHDDRAEGIIFLNIDQLVLGSVREQKGIKSGTVVIDILERISTAHISSFSPSSVGYLTQGWYGRDSIFREPTINSLFVKNSLFRYMYNRYITIVENAQLRNNRYLKKDVTTALFNTSLGTLFIYDTELAPLRYSAHKAFWSAIIEAENCFWRDTEGPSLKEWDYEEIGSPSFIMSNKTYLCVISPKGASASEFDYLPLGINFFDTRPSIDLSSGLRKSFEDRIRINDIDYSTDDILFQSEFLDKKRTEVVLTASALDKPFLITKRYKLKANTFTLDSTLTPAGKKKMSGSYSISIYLSFPDGVLLLPEQRMNMVATGSVEAKTVKYGSREANASLTISSTQPFTLREETESVREITALGIEDFVIYKKITFIFPLECGVDESVTYRLNIRDISNK